MIRLHVGIDHNIAGDEVSLAGGGRQDRIYQRDSQPLAQSLIVDEEKGVVFDDGTANRSAELIPFESRYGRSIEEVPGVERAVAEELVRGAVQGVGAGASNGIDHAA